MVPMRRASRRCRSVGARAPWGSSELAAGATVEPDPARTSTIRAERASQPIGWRGRRNGWVTVMEFRLVGKDGASKSRDAGWLAARKADSQRSPVYLRPLAALLGIVMG